MSSVLIVDDALFMRQMIRDALEPLGFDEVLEAENGREGLEMFVKHKPDITTLDIVMPEMDGIEVLQGIRSRSKDAKVIMITAVDQREMMLQSMKLGINDFIVKPFEEERVISTVEKVLQRGNIKE